MIKNIKELIFRKLEEIIEEYNDGCRSYYNMSENDFSEWYDNLKYIKDFNFINLTHINFEELENPFIHFENIRDTDFSDEISNYIFVNHINDIEDIDIEEVLDYMYSETQWGYYVNVILWFRKSGEIQEDYIYNLFGSSVENSDILDTEKVKSLKNICSILNKNEILWVRKNKEDIKEFVNQDVILLDNIEEEIEEELLLDIAEEFFTDYKDKFKLKIYAKKFMEDEYRISDMKFGFEEIDKSQYLEFYNYLLNEDNNDINNSIFEWWLFTTKTYIMY